MNYRFELTEQEAQLILNTLYELPAKASMSLILKMQSQAQVQQKLEQEPKSKKQ